MTTPTEPRRTWHPTRAAAVEALESTTGMSAHELYRTSFFQHYQKDARYAFQTMFFRGIAIPSAAAEQLHGTEVLTAPEKWAIDNTYEMVELIWNGLDSERGRILLQAMENKHRSIPISEPNRTYLICSFIVTPFEHVDRWSWRKSLPVEHDAAHAFFTDLGRRINVGDLPGSYEEARRFVGDYEREHQRPSDEARRIVQAVARAIGSRGLPGTQAATLNTLAVLVDNRPITDALGLRYPGSAAERAIRATVRSRATALARQPMPTGVSWFWPGRPVKNVYPLGYDVSEAGFVPRG